MILRLLRGLQESLPCPVELSTSMPEMNQFRLHFKTTYPCDPPRAVDYEYTFKFDSLEEYHISSGDMFRVFLNAKMTLMDKLDQVMLDLENGKEA
jgi:hypothetical protein